MKKALWVFLILPLFILSCSKDNDDDDINDSNSDPALPAEGPPIVINPALVFTGGLPKQIDDLKIESNADGLISKIVDQEDGAEITFTYGANIKTKATAADSYPTDVIMKYTDEYESYSIYMEIGANNFVDNCIQVYADKTTETWAFKYNEDGQLTEMKRSEGDNETTSMTYKDGNIVKVIEVSEADPKDKTEAAISYSAQDNKGAIMFFDETMAIDMDEMIYAYYAGLLGKATKKLPSQLVYVDEDLDTSTFNWVLNTVGLPTKLSITEGEYTSDYSFKW